MKKLASISTVVLMIAMAFSFLPASIALAATGPVTSAVTVVPNPVPFNTTATLTASVDNTVLASNVVSAEYSLDGGLTWTAMAAASGFTFGSALTMNVTATFTAKMGETQVCVHANDALGDIGPDACIPLTVKDNLPPIVSNVKVAAVLMGSTGTATVTATIDDSTTGGSNIASAAYTLNGGTPVAMQAVDGAFDAVSEAVTATINPISAGANTICVTGTDAAGNTSAATGNACITFTLIVFKGFQSPIVMGVTNKANAPQTIPIKFWLTNANGSPVTQLSRGQILSYQVDCTSLTGDPTTGSAIGSPGKSGLKYQGNGRWHINWKTSKSFIGTCRAMFVQISAYQNSPTVVFDFRKPKK
ncbi:MAG TPA: PxKF domain-containing protein [Anaerolineaceae bacterium]|nr:PxKF domain-containing protein [Anaerolineaceae bacterium]